LNLRKDLASKSPTVATVKHGDKLEVLELRRRFIKVRTEQHVEGWTDSNLLLTDQQMGDLRRLAEDASKLVSQGKATPFDVLNMHSAPARQSPSFFQIGEGESVEVIGHRLAPHSAPPEPMAVAAPVKRTVPKKPKSKQGPQTAGELAESFAPPGDGYSRLCASRCRRGRRQCAAERRLGSGSHQGRQGRMGARPHALHVDSR
jgi:hypothetical protein